MPSAPVAIVAFSLLPTVGQGRGLRPHPRDYAHEGPMER